MGATFSRLKTWGAEVLTFADLNDEIDNILENLTPVGVDDFSVNVAQMKLTEDPGEPGSESLAESLAEEIERLRFMIKEITGESEWYESSPYSLATLGTSVGGGISPNRIISGKTQSASSQSNFLTPAGSARTVTLDATPTPFVYAVNNVEYTVAVDKTVTNLSLAPATDNTCLVNDPNINSTEETKYVGEYGSELVVDAMATNISTLVGKLAGFKISNGVNNEYFIARVDSTTKLSNIQRGFFFDSTLAAVPRITIADNNTITLMKLTWLFISTTGTLLPVYTEPRVSASEPTAPSVGDYWFDLVNGIWKIYSGGTFIDATATFIGYCMQDTSNCIVARGADYFRGAVDTNTIQLAIQDNTEVRSVKKSDIVAIYGSSIKFDPDYVRWDIDTDLDTGLTEAADTLYFLYLNENGKPIISTTGPYNRPDFAGLYHPYNTWRAIGSVYNNASSNFEAVVSYSDLSENNYAISHKVASNALTVKLHAPPNLRFKMRGTSLTDGAPSFASVLPGTQFIASSGSTLGTSDATAESFVAHLVRSNGRAVLGLSYCQLNRNALHTTIAEAGNADLPYPLYTYGAITTTPVTPIARLESTQATAGVWASALTNVSTTARGNTYKENSIKYIASATPVVPSGITRMRVLGNGGGGGGGGGGATAASGGGGGGGAGPIYDRLITVVPEETLTITIGAGGAGGASAASGTAGTDSTIVGSISGTIATFLGGGGGGRGASGAVTGGDATSSLSMGGNGGGANSTGGGGGGGGSTGRGGNGNSTSVQTGDNGAGGGGGGGVNSATGNTGNAGGTSIYSGPAAAGGTAENAAGGGGGGGSGFGIGGAGGNGANTPTVGSPGTANTGAGGGGGGGSGDAGAGAAGGAGAGGQITLMWSAT